MKSAIASVMVLFASISVVVLLALNFPGQDGPSARTYTQGDYERLYDDYEQLHEDFDKVSKAADEYARLLHESLQREEGYAESSDHRSLIIKRLIAEVERARKPEEEARELTAKPDQG